MSLYQLRPINNRLREKEPLCDIFVSATQTLSILSYGVKRALT